jgi:hypothetical protein
MRHKVLGLKDAASFTTEDIGQNRADQAHLIINIFSLLNILLSQSIEFFRGKIPEFLIGQPKMIPPECPEP